MGNLVTIAQVRQHVERAQSEDDYSAVNMLWLGLVKAAQMFEGNQTAQGQALMAALDPARLDGLLQSEGVEALIGLDPPIESIVTYRDEEDHLDAARAAAKVRCIKEHRSSDPRRATVCLAWLLRRIRNRREHGYKTPDGRRDREILSAARACMEELTSIVLDQFEA